MRTIVAFSFLAALAAAQTSQTESTQLQNLEQSLALKPDNPGARVQILQLLTVPTVIDGLPYDRIVETRRRQVLWLIQSHPEQRNVSLRAPQMIPQRGPWADPEGYAESVRLWKERASRPGAPTEVIANAAIYLKATDRVAARALLDAALQAHPAGGALWRAVGMVDAAAMAGVTGPGDRGQFAADAALKGSAEAKRAAAEIESADNAFLLGGAAQMLAGNLIQNQNQLSLGEVDAETIADRWLRRAIAIAPTAEEWKAQLAPLVRSEANRAEDPRERARLFSEAIGFAAERDKSTYLADLAKAEFEAGDDAAATRDARRVVEAAAELVKRNPFQAATMINAGNSVLGRIALAHGDVAEAQARLRASLDVAESTDFRFAGPDMTLAGDLADAGERDAVISYLESSREFWPHDRGLVDHYIKSIKAGKKREAFANYPHPSSEIVNRPAPEFKLHEPGGKEWTLKSIAGKPAALIFWNASCQSCAGQIAEFAKAAAATDVRLLAVNVGDSDPAVAAYVEKNHISATILEGSQAMAAAYRADTYPSVAMIDTRGRITQYQVGAVANPPQILETAARPRVGKPVAIQMEDADHGVMLAWRPVPGAQSYVVEWEARDRTGWPSDRDGFLSVVPTGETHVTVPCAQPQCSGSLRWRVFAVGFGAAGEATAWQSAGHLQ
jgi:peroxiredoxin